MTTLEIALLILCGLLAGGLLGATWEVRKLHREAWQYWLAQNKAQKEAHEARAALAEANKRLGALHATRGEVLEAAIATSKLAQLDALRQSDSSHTHHTR